jgi:hypothetical protein
MPTSAILVSDQIGQDSDRSLQGSSGKPLRARDFADVVSSAAAVVKTRPWHVGHGDAPATAWRLPACDLDARELRRRGRTGDPVSVGHGTGLLEATTGDGGHFDPVADLAEMR